jgi:hypothetical protein
MRPWYYFNFTQNVFIVLIILALVSLYFNLSTTFNGIIFALISVLQYIVGAYDNNVINAITPNRIMGLAFALSGVIPPLLSFVAVALAAAQFSNATNVSIILGFHVAYLLYAIGYGVLQSENIKKMLDDSSRFSATSFYQAWIMGYGVRWKEEKKDD